MTEQQSPRKRITLGACLRSVLGRESCFEEELVPLLIARRLAVPVRTFEVTVVMMGGRTFRIKADPSCAVESLKLHIQKTVRKRVRG